MFTRRLPFLLRTCSIESTNPAKCCSPTVNYSTISSSHKSYRTHVALTFGIGMFAVGITQYIVQSISMDVNTNINSNINANTNTNMDARLETLRQHMDRKFDALDGKISDLAQQLNDLSRSWSK